MAAANSGGARAPESGSTRGAHRGLRRNEAIYVSTREILAASPGGFLDGRRSRREMEAQNLRGEGEGFSRNNSAVFTLRLWPHSTRRTHGNDRFYFAPDRTRRLCPEGRTPPGGSGTSRRALPLPPSVGSLPQDAKGTMIDPGVIDRPDSTSGRERPICLAAARARVRPLPHPGGSTRRPVEAASRIPTGRSGSALRLSHE